jgi:endonuclease-3
MDSINIETIVKKIMRVVKNFEEPAVTQIANSYEDPFKILISTILSLRTKDKTTHDASIRLFETANTPEKILKLSDKEIEKLIYPVGFYHKKAATIKKISKEIIQNNGKVPDTLEELLKLPGVGRKTANLVLSEGFGKPAICVDTHVHRVSNRLGLVNTKTPEQTEFALMGVLPKKFWSIYNRIIVPFGQNICKPVSPLCSKCPLNDVCPKLGVKKHR